MEALRPSERKWRFILYILLVNCLGMIELTESSLKSRTDLSHLRPKYVCLRGSSKDLGMSCLPDSVTRTKGNSNQPKSKNIVFLKTARRKRAARKYSRSGRRAAGHPWGAQARTESSVENSRWLLWLSQSVFVGSWEHPIWWGCFCLSFVIYFSYFSFSFGDSILMTICPSSPPPKCVIYTSLISFKFMAFFNQLLLHACVHIQIVKCNLLSPYLYLCFQGWLFGIKHPIRALFPGKDHLSHSQLYPVACSSLCGVVLLKRFPGGDTLLRPGISLWETPSDCLSLVISCWLFGSPNMMRFISVNQSLFVYSFTLPCAQ